MPSIFITGCSSGIGKAACELFAEKGWTVYAGSRKPSTLTFEHASIVPTLIDVNDNGSIAACFENFRKENIHLDCVVNNAGYGILRPFEDTDPKEIEALLRTNVLGLMEVCRHAARMMREGGGGTILNVSSVIGTIGVPWYAAYCASKWAVEGFSESLAHELSPFNIKVKIIEPGSTKTSFHDIAYRTDNHPITAAYKERYERKRASRGGANDDAPELIATLLWQAANDRSKRLRYGAPQARRVLLWQRLLGRDGLWRRLEKGNS
jgi:NAD(P)-dependent dehydrogenase (short-subunit alcohol dehydrogenase family)